MRGRISTFHFWFSLLEVPDTFNGHLGSPLHNPFVSFILSEDCHFQINYVKR